jgi:hypothetical protein
MKDFITWMLVGIISLALVFVPACALARQGRIPGPGGMALAGGVTWTVVQHPHNFTCSAATSGNLGCTVTASATTAGHLLILVSSAFEGQTGTNHTAPTFVSASGDSTWTHCASSYAHVEYTINAFENADCAYILSATGGATSFTFTWSFPTSTDSAAVDVELLEVARSSGTAAFDTGNTATSSGCASCVGPTLTLSGASDYIAQWNGNANGCTAISGAYTNPFDNDNSNVFGTFAGALNQSSGTGPTWTCTSGGAAMSGISFK